MDNENTKVGRKAKNDLYNAAFSVRMRNLFEENNITQATVAEKLGTTRQTIGNWLLGKSQPDFETLIKIADYFNTTTDYLLGRTKTKTINEDVRTVCDYLGLEEESLKYLRVSKTIPMSIKTPFKPFSFTPEILEKYFIFYTDAINELLQSNSFIKIIESCAYEKLLEFLLNKAFSLDIEKINQDENSLYSCKIIEKTLRDYENKHDLNIFNIQKSIIKFATELTDIENFESYDVEKKLDEIYEELLKCSKDGEPDGND